MARRKSKPSEASSDDCGRSGLTGDQPLGSNWESLIGTRVTAKRLVWDDGPEDDDPDRTPCDEMGYDSPDLAGVLSVLRFTLPDGTPGVGWEVGGQPADPATVRPTRWRQPVRLAAGGRRGTKGTPNQALHLTGGGM